MEKKDVLLMLKNQDVNMKTYIRGDIIKRGLYWFADIETEERTYTMFRFNTRDEATAFLDCLGKIHIDNKVHNALVAASLLIVAGVAVMCGLIYIFL